MSNQMSEPIFMPCRLAYDTDLTDEEWHLVKPIIETAQTGPGPRRSVNLREVLNALLYKQRTGCQWRMLPHDLPPRSTVSGYYQRWTKTGVWDQVNMVLRRHAREKENRSAPGNIPLTGNELLPPRHTTRQQAIYADSMN
jgi:putative transposase